VTRKRGTHLDRLSPVWKMSRSRRVAPGFLSRAPSFFYEDVSGHVFVSLRGSRKFVIEIKISERNTQHKPEKKNIDV
jgi:hypothetical protein